MRTWICGRAISYDRTDGRSAEHATTDVASAEQLLHEIADPTPRTLRLAAGRYDLAAPLVLPRGMILTVPLGSALHFPHRPKRYETSGRYLMRPILIAE